MVSAIAHGLLNLLDTFPGKISSEKGLNPDHYSDLLSLRELEELGADAVIFVELVSLDLSDLCLTFPATG